MARTLTLGEIVALIQRKADIVNQTERWPLVAIREDVNQSVSALRDEIIRARGHSYYEKNASLTATPATDPADSVVNLPTDFYQLLSVYWLDGGDRVPLESFEQQDRLGRDDEDDTTLFPRYRVIAAVDAGAALELQPTPSGNRSLKVYYIPYAPRLSTDGSADDLPIDGFNGWEMYLVWDVAAQIIAEEERDPSFCLSKLTEIKQRISGLAPHRDAGGVEKIADWRSHTDDRLIRRARGTW